MNDASRRTFIRGLGASVALAPGMTFTSARAARAAEKPHPHLTRMCPEQILQTDQVRAWHAAKDSMGGPTIAGSPSWKNYLDLLERDLRACGVVDIVKNPWTYSRWATAEWPAETHWSLAVDGRKIRVASYGCNSGQTPDAGSTGPLVVYEEGMPPEAFKGRIAIVVKPQAKTLMAGGALDPAAERPSDYEYLSSPETFADPRIPQAETVPVSPFRQMGLAPAEQKALIDGGALGAVIILGLSYEAAAGTYTFPVPAHYALPTLYLDFKTGADLLAAAKAGKDATLRLIAETEDCETYQLFGWLPGANYGKPEDEQILLVTHTDGPSISQENGALGILGMVKYFSHLPPEKRPRTLMVFLDCRHYMPGMERAFAAQDYAASHPDLYQKVVAAMGIEHLGQMQVAETNEKPYRTTGLPEVSTLWATNNPRLVEIAVKAVKDNELKRIQVQCPGRLGIHGAEQGPWYGLGAIARRLGVPGAATMGTMSAYWSSKARMDYLDADHFVAQVSTMSQICGELMIAEMAPLRSAPGEGAPRPSGI